jgi:hypothetical protein
VKIISALSELDRPYSVDVEFEERLPFRVRFVDSAQDLA